MTSAPSSLKAFNRALSGGAIALSALIALSIAAAFPISAATARGCPLGGAVALQSCSR